MENRSTDFNWIVDLYELGMRAATGGHPQHALRAILDHVVRGLDAQSGSIAAGTGSAPDRLELAAGTDLPPGWLGMALPPGTGLYGHVVATGQPLLANGDAAETGLPPRIADSEGDGRACRSAMCWPLVAGGATIGALAVGRAPNRSRFTVQDLDRHQPMMRFVAQVIANHRMHVERENRIVELRALNATMQRVNDLLEDAQGQAALAGELTPVDHISEAIHHQVAGPIELVGANLASLEAHLARLLALLAEYAQIDDAASGPAAAVFERARSLRRGADVADLRDGVDSLIDESHGALVSVKRIIDDLRPFTPRAAAGVLEKADLRRIVDEVLDRVRGDIEFKAEVVRDYGAMPEVECDAVRLSQVFYHLIVNAGQAIESRGTIRVATGATASEAWVQVEDTGCGIRPDNLRRIFEPFFTARAANDGAGLGLATSNAIVRDHGGHIDVESEVGCGSRFTVRLPLRKRDESGAPALQLAEDTLGTG